MLKPWFIPVKHIFKQYTEYVLDGANNDKHRIFIDRGGLVLFVAHLDTVQVPKIFKSNKKYIYGRGFDDRLGCAWAYKLSEELGADLLLTDHEEFCKSTAFYHKVKDYNWIVEFDREGVDIVTYDLDSIDFGQALLKYWSIGFGSYSDIRDLKTDACCFNLGLGHYGSHSKKALVKTREMQRQIAKFKTFYAANKDIKYVQVERQGSRICEFCYSQNGVEIFNTVVCSNCFKAMTDNFWCSGNDFGNEVEESICDYCYENYPLGELRLLDSFKICRKCESHVFI